MITIKEKMAWPPSDLTRFKIKEHATWYAGDPNMLADFYANNSTNDYLGIPRASNNKNTFWGRQIKNNSSFFMHVPIASDIAETSAGFLFGESPLVRFPNNNDASEAIAQDQKELDKMLVKSGFFQKLLQAAESASAVGGIYIIVSWDSDVSPYPIPVVMQPDNVFPEFKFGVLSAVDCLISTFRNRDNTGKEGSTYYRMFERREPGKIITTLFEGSESNLGQQIPLTQCEETKDIEPEVTIKGYDKLTAVYIPNMLPNRLARQSCEGRSDLQGIETLMDALDETFSAWMKDIQFAKGKIHVPKEFLEENDSGKVSFNIDEDMYVKLEGDPLSMEGAKITATQFAIRANDFEKSCLNLLDRIITSAGYSPQSFGLNIAGRAESGTALNVRERKSFITTSKKQAFWEEPIKKLVEMMVAIYTTELGGKITSSVEDINVEFCDSVANNMAEISNSIKTLSDAKAISTDTKVRMAHPEWTDSQVAEEVDKILNDGAVPNPDDNPDITQMKQELIDEEGNNNQPLDKGNQTEEI